MKILLILASDNTYYYKGAFSRSISYAPLTLTTLAALVPQQLDADITIIDEGVQPVHYDRLEADIVAISCVTSSAPRAYTLAKQWKSRGAYTVIGGVHVTLNPDEAGCRADTVICGGAEESWPKFLIDYVNGTPEKFYKGNSSTGIIVPIPGRELLPKRRYLSIPTVLANRGCINSCEFCSINRLWNGRTDIRPVDHVIEEIKGLNTRQVIFLDPNITVNREYALKLFEALIPLNIKWAGLSSIGITRDDELFDLMIRSGCSAILVGFESMNQNSLIECGKTINSVAHYSEAVAKFHKESIPVLGTFMLGFDYDTRQSIEKMVEQIDATGIDLPRYAVLTPFPGTPLFTQYERSGRLLTTDWSFYDTEHVVFKPHSMSAAELQSLLYQTWKRSYTIKRILKRISRLDRMLFFALLVNLGFRRYAKLLKTRVAPDGIPVFNQSSRENNIG